MKLFNIKTISKPRLILGIGAFGTILLLGMLSLVIVSSSHTLKPVQVNKADVALRVEVPHVENELVVRYEDGKSTESLQGEIDRREKLAISIIGKSRVVVENTILKMTNNHTPEEDYNEIQNIFAKTGVIKQTKIFSDNSLPLRNYYVLTFKSGTDLVTAQKTINASSLFDFAQGNYVSFLTSTPNDPDYSKQWGYQSISAPQAWNHTTGSRDITVAVIDSGIEQAHPDIPENVISGPDLIEGGSSFNDTVGHGTHVSGIIGAHTNNGIGVAGVNWNPQLMAIRVCKSTTTSPYNTCNPNAVVRGINYAVNQNARVINLSLGSQIPCTSVPIYQDTINMAISRNVVVVSAAGNSGVNAVQSTPASCQGVITVGAIDQNNARSIWPGGHASNYGDRVDIAAPGTGILSTYKNSSYVQDNGTSQAAPFVSGAAALLLSVNPSLKPEQVKDCILNSADPIQTDLPVGGRKLNVFHMLQRCGDIPADTDTPTQTPTARVTIIPQTTDTSTPTPTRVPGTAATNTPIPTPTLTSTPTSTLKATPTPTGKVLQLYDCEQKTDTQIVDGKPIQISWLDCKPL